MLYLVVGPPAAGKSTWCRAHAGPEAIVIDFDRLALALSVRTEQGHEHPDALKRVTKAARAAAIDAALDQAHAVDVFVIHSTPALSTVHRYLGQGARLVVIDPGREVVTARVKTERPWWAMQVVAKWYAECHRLPPAWQPDGNQAQPIQQTSSNVLDWGDQAPPPKHAGRGPLTRSGETGNLSPRVTPPGPRSRGGARRAT